MNEELTGNIVENDTLSGDIIESQDIEGRVESNEELTGNIVEIDILSGDIIGSQDIEGRVENEIIRVSEPGEQYIGEYEVTPSVSEQILVTNNKRMTSDVTVKVIPISEVSNPSGGLTVYIG